MELMRWLRWKFMHQPTAPPAAPTLPLLREEPRSRPAHYTPARLARDLLNEYLTGVPEEVLIARAEAEGLRPDTIARLVLGLRAEPRKTTEPQRRAINASSMEVTDLTSLPSVRTRIKGSSYSVTDTERRRYGGTEYLLVREPDNRADAQAVAVFGKGHRVGYLSQARAASTSPLLAQIGGDAFRVTGTGTTANSSVLWVDAPKVDGLRRLRDQQEEDRAPRV